MTTNSTNLRRFLSESPNWSVSPAEAGAQIVARLGFQLYPERRNKKPELPTVKKNENLEKLLAKP